MDGPLQQSWGWLVDNDKLHAYHQLILAKVYCWLRIVRTDPYRSF